MTHPLPLYNSEACVARMQEMCAAAGLTTQQKIAEAAGHSRSGIANWFSRMPVALPAEPLLRLCHHCGWRPEYIMFGTGPRTDATAGLQRDVLQASLRVVLGFMRKAPARFKDATDEEIADLVLQFYDEQAATNAAILDRMEPAGPARTALNG